MIRLSVATGILATAMLSGGAAAEPTRDGSDVPQGPVAIRERLVITTPLTAFTAPHAAVSPTIYLERCKGGCMIVGGAVNNAQTNTSTIPPPGNWPIAEYQNGAGQNGAAADAEWALLVQCMKEVYSPFNATVTDVKPGPGTSYHQAVIAGGPGDIRLAQNILGVAPLASDCSPHDNVISFSFANAHPQTETISRVNNLCWTAAQESAHAFGLDHQYSFISDDRSACNDPMTYRVDCGGQKFFRNEPANCGEDGTRMCRCGSSQNSHAKLIAVFGVGTSIVAAPTAAVSTPAPGVTTLGALVVGQAGSKRGVSKVEFYLNDYKWSESKGVPYGPSGQPVPGQYSFTLPGTFPNSIVDIRIKAYDDLGNATESAVVTATKGAPCETADTCAKGQKCETGRCFWDAPVGELGKDCDFPQYCLSGVCAGTTDEQICTQECIPEVDDSCPEDYVCNAIGGGKGICFFPDGGCCSVAGDRRMPWLQLVISSLIFGLLVRPRRRRTAPRRGRA